MPTCARCRLVVMVSMSICAESVVLNRVDKQLIRAKHRLMVVSDNWHSTSCYMSDVDSQS